MNATPRFAPLASAPSRDHAAAPPSPGPVRRMPCARLQSSALLAGAQEIEIDHLGAIYRLRITSLGKLILTK